MEREEDQKDPENVLKSIKNESQKISLSELVYYLDAIDGSQGLDIIRTDALANLNASFRPKKILDYNHGFGYSAIQLSSIYTSSKIYSLQPISAFKDAYEYTLNRNRKNNINYSVEYPSDMINQLMKEKVDLITMFNPLGIETKEIGKFLDISQEIATEGSKLLIQSPLTDLPRFSLVAEWLGLCVEGMGLYSTLENYKVLLSHHSFEVETISKEQNVIIANYRP